MNKEEMLKLAEQCGLGMVAENGFWIDYRATLANVMKFGQALTPRPAGDLGDMLKLVRDQIDANKNHQTMLAWHEQETPQKLQALLMQLHDLTNTAPDCGACPGDGSICPIFCQVEADSPPIIEEARPATKQDLAALLKRLCVVITRKDPGNEHVKEVTDYLKRHGYFNPMRAQEN